MPSIEHTQCREHHIAAWKALTAYVTDQKQVEIELPKVAVDFFIALGRVALNIPEVTEELEKPGARVYPIIRLFPLITGLYADNVSSHFVYDTIGQSLEVYQGERILLSFYAGDFSHHIEGLQSKTLFVTELTDRVMEQTLAEAQAVVEWSNLNPTQETVVEPEVATGLSPDVQEALELHRRVWSALQSHVQHTFNSIVTIPGKYVTFMVAVGRALASIQDSQLVNYPDAAKQALDRKQIVPEEEPKAQQVSLMTPSLSEPPPETAQIAAEMTMALWRSWGLNSQAVLGAVARAVEEPLPVIEGDRIGSMIARQFLMAERLNDYVRFYSQSKAVVKLPSAYADYLLTLAALYVTFRDLSEEPVLIFEELHSKYLAALSQQGKSDNWQAYYNSVSSTLKLTTLLYPYTFRAVEKHLPWNDARNSYISFEPLLEAEPKDSRWPVRVTVNAPWDFEIERLILGRFERRYSEAGTLDPISLQVLESLDSMVKVCLQQLKERV